MGCRWTGHPWNCTVDDPTLVYREIVDGRSDYKKSFCGDVGNVTCGDSTGSNWTEKDRIRDLLDLFGGRCKKGWCDLVCGGVFR